MYNLISLVCSVVSPSSYICPIRNPMAVVPVGLMVSCEVVGLCRLYYTVSVGWIWWQLAAGAC